MLNVGVIAQRAVGKYPLSIATSLALEGLQGEHPDKPTNVNLLPKYNVVWVNLKTIFRNLYHAINREDVLSVTPLEFQEAFNFEVENFISTVKSISDSKLEVILYVDDYADLDRTYPKAIIRVDSTKLQQAYTAAMVFTMSPYLKENNKNINFFKLKIKVNEPRKALMLTHYPYDLLAKGFSNLSLLESHTGAVKDKFLWYTKYLNGKELPMIPFREDFIQIFGDEQLFRPWGMGVRKQIIELAIKYNWSQATSTDKIKYCIDTLRDKYLRDNIRAVMKV